jgi:hypothetical protein
MDITQLELNDLAAILFEFKQLAGHLSGSERDRLTVCSEKIRLMIINSKKTV